MKLSILIPTTPDRYWSLQAILRCFEKQSEKWAASICKVNSEQFFTTYIYDNKIEVLIFEDNKQRSIGYKRNYLYEKANGEYCASFDSDDLPSENYFSLILNGIKNSPDCLSLRGEMTTDGKDPQTFEHSLQYSEWKDNGSQYPAVRYERYPNHLNVIRSYIAKQFKFPEINHGEDKAWSDALHESGLLKTQGYIDKVIYFYKYRTKK